MPDLSHQGPPKHEDEKGRSPRLEKRPLSFEEFYQSFSETISQAAIKDSLFTVLRTLKRGYAGEVHTEHIDQVFELVRTYRSADRLAVQLTVLPKRPSGIAIAIRNKLRTWGEAEIGFPAAKDGEDRVAVLATWIDESTAKWKQPDNSQNPSEWVRIAFACLSKESDSNRSETAHQILKSFARAAKRGQPIPFRTSIQSFLREVAKLISARTISPGKVSGALQFAHPLEERSREDHASLTEMARHLEEATTRSHELADENNRLQRQVQDGLSREKDLERQLTDAQERIALQKEQLTEREKHWEKTSQQSLARQRHEIVSAIGHELQEACLALDRDKPNTDMALNRLRRAQESLRRPDENK